MPAFPILTACAVGDDLVQTVDARDLHAFLGVGRDFTNWIKGRIAKYGFSLGSDFVTEQGFDPPERANQTGRGGDRRSVAYHLTLDMAKELSMVENNAQGRAARRYFIECERRLKGMPAAAGPGSGRYESFDRRLRAVAECRRAYGLRAARELWIALGLPIVPAMLAAPAQSEMAFGLEGAPVGGHA